MKRTILALLVLSLLFPSCSSPPRPKYARWQIATGLHPKNEKLMLFRVHTQTGYVEYRVFGKTREESKDWRPLQGTDPFAEPRVPKEGEEPAVLPVNYR